MPNPVTQGGPIKAASSQSYENLGPAGHVRITIITLTGNAAAVQLDSVANSGGPLLNRRRVRIYSLAAPASTPVIAAMVGFDSNVAAGVGVPVYSFPGGFVEIQLDSNIPVWAFAAVTVNMALFEESTG